MSPTAKTLKSSLKIAALTAFIFSCAAFVVMNDVQGAWRLLTGNSVVSAHEGPSSLLQQVGTIDVPGPKGKRFDYLTIDSSRHLLFSTHLGAGLLYAIDLRTNKVVKTFEGLPGIEGVEIAPDVNKAYTSNWQENKIGVIDLQQMKLVKKLLAS